MSIESVRAFFAEKAPALAVIEAATSSDTVAPAASDYGGDPARIANEMSFPSAAFVTAITRS